MIDCEQFLYSHKSRPAKMESERNERQTAESRRLIRSLARNVFADGTIVKDYY